MEKTDKEKVKTSKNRIMDRLSQEYPDIDFNAENASDVVDDSIASMLDKYDAELEGYRANDKRIKDLFKDDPKSSRFVMILASDRQRQKAGEEVPSPVERFLEIYGSDFVDALQSDEGKAVLVKKQAEWAERKAAEEAGEATRAANFEQSINDLVAFADEKKMSDEEAVNMLQRLNDILDEALEGKYSRDTMDMLYKAMVYDGDVAKARTEGERDGRNAKIEERLSKVTKAPDMPPSLRGQGGTVAEPAPKKEVDPVLEGMRERMRKGPGTRGTFGK